MISNRRVVGAFLANGVVSAMAQCRWVMWQGTMMGVLCHVCAKVKKPFMLSEVHVGLSWSI